MERALKEKPFFFDSRRKIAIMPSKEEAIHYAAEHFVEVAQQAINKRGGFFVALSGGSTPKALYELLLSAYRSKIDWTKVHLFFSDERAVPPQDPNSNYRMAMDAGFASLPIPKEQIHRMVAEENIEENALKYEKLLDTLPGGSFDLMLLGMGEDGHTASLFPKTHGLHAEGRQVIANFLPDKEIWRMSVTFECINHSRNILVFVLGASKADMVQKVFYGPFLPDLLPIQRVGSEQNPALFLFDRDAAMHNFKR